MSEAGGGGAYLVHDAKGEIGHGGGAGEEGAEGAEESGDRDEALLHEVREVEADDVSRLLCDFRRLPQQGHEHERAEQRRCDSCRSANRPLL